MDCPHCEKLIEPEDLAKSPSPDPAPSAPVEQGAASVPAPGAPSPAQSGESASLAPLAAPASGAAQGQAKHSSKLAEVMRLVAEFMGVVPTLVKDPIVSGVSFVATEALDFIANAVESKGSANAETEAQAEKTLSDILAKISDLNSPLPSPEQIEAGAATQTG